MGEGIKSKVTKGLAGATSFGRMMGTPKQAKAKDSEPERTERIVSFSASDLFKKRDRNGNTIIGVKKAARVNELNYACEFYRVEKKRRTVYFVVFSIVSKSTVPTINRGLTMEFVDGTKIEKPNAEVNVSVHSLTEYEYVTRVQVSQEEAEMLALKALKGYTFHGKKEQKAIMKGADAKDLQEQVYVIMNIKLQHEKDYV